MMNVAYVVVNVLVKLAKNVEILIVMELALQVMIVREFAVVLQ